MRVGVRVDLLHPSQVELLTEDDPELLAHSHIKQVDVLVRVRVRDRDRVRARVRDRVRVRVRVRFESDRRAAWSPGQATPTCARAGRLPAS